MKSEHRHELKTNELAEWLGNLPQWASENFKYIIGLTALIVILVGLYAWRAYTKELQAREQAEFTILLNSISEMKNQIISGQSQGSDFSYLLMQPADELRNFAEYTQNDSMAALALIKEAEVLRTELHYRSGTINNEQLTVQINRAKDSYNKAIQRASSPLLISLATFGLGLCEEELGNFDQARQIYQDVVANPEFIGTIALAQAETRLETMSNYGKDIIFQPAPIQVSTAPTQPLIQINPADANLPADDNLLTDVNVSVKTEVLPPVEVIVPAVPEANPAPEFINITPNNIDANVPVE